MCTLCAACKIYDRRAEEKRTEYRADVVMTESIEDLNHQNECCNSDVSNNSDVKENAVDSDVR